MIDQTITMTAIIPVQKVRTRMLARLSAWLLYGVSARAFVALAWTAMLSGLMLVVLGTIAVMYGGEYTGWYVAGLLAITMSSIALGRSYGRHHKGRLRRNLAIARYQARPQAKFPLLAAVQTVTIISGSVVAIVLAVGIIASLFGVAILPAMELLQNLR